MLLPPSRGVRLFLNDKIAKNRKLLRREDDSMREWSFYMPTKVHFGERILKREAGVIAAYGKNAFVVTGKSSSKRNGSLDDLLDILKELDLKVHIFDEVEENPTFGLVGNAAEECRRVGADVVIGVGGGSPLDTAKAVAILAVNEFLKQQGYPK